MRGKTDIRRGQFLLLLIVLVLALLVIPSCGGGGRSGTVGVQAPFVTVLPAGALVADSVVYPQINYYAAAVVPGAFYKISITAMNDDADLLVFGSDGTFTFLSRCSVDNTAFNGTGPEDCVIRAPGSALYFGVDGIFLRGSVGFFTISVEPVATTTMTLDLPRVDTLGRWEARIYAVPVTVPDNYTVSITGLSNDADLIVFGSDALLSAPAACLVDNTQRIGPLPEDCTLLSGGGVLYFVVDGLFSSTAAVSYTALAAPAAP